MDPVRIGTTLRAVRPRHRWRQADVAARAGISRTTVSRLEAGHVGTLTVDTLERVAAVLGTRIDVTVRWRGGDLARLIDAGHAAMHETMAALFRDRSGWVAIPEVSFSVFGERGVIDVLAWHEQRRVVLVVELKTQLVDLSELLGTLDRKRRLAPVIARERGWQSGTVATWLAVADTAAARRTLTAHSTVLRGAYPADGRRMRAWLRTPDGPIAALTFLDNARLRHLRPGSRRVGRLPTTVGGRQTTVGERDRATDTRPPRPTERDRRRRDLVDLDEGSVRVR